MPRWDWAVAGTDVTSQCPDHWEISKHAGYRRKEDPTGALIFLRGAWDALSRF